MAEKRENYWKDIVEKVDSILEKAGASAVQEVPSKGRTLYGYKPQFVIDALNSVVGANGWGYKIVNESVTEVENKKGEKRFLAWVKVRLWVGDTESFKEAFGGSENFTPGDALKGATTDAIQKALSLFSIGRKAYRGELKELLPKEEKKEGLKATQKQIEFIKKLAQETGTDITNLNFNHLSQERASRIIEQLMLKKKAS
ncbi:Rad52/Rad22 family DNA repair protein [Thermovibrio sp.]